MLSLTPAESKSTHVAHRRHGRNRRGGDHLQLTERFLQRLNQAFAIQGVLPPAMRYVPDNQTFKFSQNYEISAALTSSNVAPQFAAFNFQIASLDQVSQLTSVFDQFMIACIEFWLIPRQVDVAAASVNNGLLTSVIDYDDSTALTTIGQALDYDNAITTSGVNGHYRVFMPHVALAAYQGAFTAYGNVRSPWCDAASTGTQHYGVKLAITQTTNAIVFDAVVRLHTQWRNVR